MGMTNLEIVQKMRAFVNRLESLLLRELTWTQAELYEQEMLKHDIKTLAGMLK